MYLKVWYTLCAVHCADIRFDFASRGGAWEDCCLSLNSSGEVLEVSYGINVSINAFAVHKSKQDITHCSSSQLFASSIIFVRVSRPASPSSRIRCGTIPYFSASSVNLMTSGINLSMGCYLVARPKLDNRSVTDILIESFTQTWLKACPVVTLTTFDMMSKELFCRRAKLKS